MFIRFLPLFALCAPADETPAPTTGGSTPPAQPTTETPPTVETPKPGVFASAKNLLSGIGATGAQVTALRADLTARDATIADLTAQLAARDATIATQLTELTTFRTQAAELQTLVTTLEQQRTDVQTEVIHQLATSGMPETALPKGGTTVIAATAEELWAQAEAESDPVKKGELATKAAKAGATQARSSN